MGVMYRKEDVRGVLISVGVMYRKEDVSLLERCPHFSGCNAQQTICHKLLET